jgi:hypothetical protein
MIAIPNAVLAAIIPVLSISGQVFPIRYEAYDKPLNKGWVKFVLQRLKMTITFGLHFNYMEQSTVNCY